MIVGVGIDLTSVSRIEKALENPETGSRFVSRVFTDEEIRYCEARHNRYQSYAARFAAKEATMKALGVGWGRQAGWLEIEVVRRRGERPFLQLTGRALERARETGVTRFTLSLTHEGGLAVAQVVAEGPGTEKE
jgi:holo-[acyl-carrier protein] synthase